MGTNQCDPMRHKIKTILVAAVFIIAGVLFLGRNLGWVDPDIFHVLVSWQMLLIVLGVGNLLTRHFVGGLTLVLVGGYFLLPEITDLGYEWVGLYWPVLLILLGVSFLFKKWRFKPDFHGHGANHSTGDYRSEDGFVTSEVTFGSVQQIVLDPVFKGARIKNTFGGTRLDLRRTQLEAGQTYIDVDCTFGGIEIYVPSTWNVLIDMDTTCSGYTDKRYHTQSTPLTEQKLVIRGDITFGGLEIKD